METIKHSGNNVAKETENTAVLFMVAHVVSALMLRNMHVTRTDMVSILRKIMDSLRV